MVVLLRLLPRSGEVAIFTPMRFLDRILYVHLALCIVIGISIGSIENAVTTIGFVIWSLIFGMFTIGYWFGRGSIPV
jgi:hypothetical protein